MTKIIYLKNGEIEVVSSSADFKDIVSEHLGDTASEYVQGLINEADFNTQKLYTDLDSYEISLEENTYAFNDILDSLRDLKIYINDAKRINRNKILKMIDSNMQIICNQI